MNNLFHVLIFTSILLRVNGGFFDRCSGKKVDSTAKKLQQKCTIDIKTCGPHEGSRVDGTCNNYKYPASGSAFGPYLRIIKNVLENDTDTMHVIDQSGKTPLPSARKVRTALQTTGRVEDKHTFTAVAAHFLQFIGKDVSAFDGPMTYLRGGKNCCQDKGKDPLCMPIRVPEDDPYLKVTDIRCLNFSRAASFQDFGCTNITQREQINFQTPVLDLSIVYGVDDTALKYVREFKQGLLKLETKEDGQSMPVNIAHKGTDTKEHNGTDTNITNVCFGDNQSVCYLVGNIEAGNYNIPTTMLTIFFMREHNRLAKALHRVQPCWKDDRLFKVARQINIATASNIFMYELLPHLLGFNNMVNYGLISPQVQHVTVYDEQVVPQVYAEYEIASRFFHTFLDGRIKRYDGNYSYVGELSLTETLFEQRVIEQDKVFEEVNRGMFYQSAAKIDDIQDPEISENYYSKFQKAYDLAAEDIQRGRDLKLRGYNEYREQCGLKRAKTFEDFMDVIDVEKVLVLKKLYKDVDDVDLLAGIQSEKFIQNTFVGTTLFCIMAKQLQLFRFSDRFWFERGDQLHSFSLGQLNEIRKTSIARLACDNAEGIKFIQPRAFLNLKRGNTYVPCAHIPALDLSKWQDSSCSKTEPKEMNKLKYPIDAKKFLSTPQKHVLDYSDFFNTFLSIRPTMD